MLIIPCQGSVEHRVRQGAGAGAKARQTAMRHPEADADLAGYARLRVYTHQAPPRKTTMAKPRPGMWWQEAS
jgi:hypothetical protein